MLNPACGGVAPIVDLDDKKYKLVQNLDAATKAGYPSLVGARKVCRVRVGHGYDVGLRGWATVGLGRPLMMGSLRVQYGRDGVHYMPMGLLAPLANRVDRKMS